ncbi:hypothetical protein N1028_06980 [Herbiconiux sp. CPCC 203407]|uniref:DUF11 domain-containing protein n=1 Tax=Herbiconiux oxytropis TaxID=2970915 RepID=A0AA41XCG1_9MICO|nr:hypothetical protein [Herbiconiux oxytropis]MCS5722054.1 hypothetical protein [Herbiconiux oxytropis]MCS5725637.1 hypothetical protein [Herbiconiux oxytropis]
MAFSPVRLVSAITSALIVAGVGAVASPPASALGCVLGPSLGGAARAVGISCPQMDGIDLASEWGRGGSPASNCHFGWESGNYPPDLLDFLSATSVTRKLDRDEDGTTTAWSLYRRGGKVVGGILIQTRPDHTFSVLIDVRGRSGYRLESVYFDCKTSSDGPIYHEEVPSDPELLPMPGIGTPVPSRPTAPVMATGAMTVLGTGNHLLRVDLTNTGTRVNHGSIGFDLGGYRVVGFPTLPAGGVCEAADGLVCSVESIAAGSTVSFVLLLQSEGTPSGDVVDVSVASLGLRKLSAGIGWAPVNKRSMVFDDFAVSRP